MKTKLYAKYVDEMKKRDNHADKKYAAMAAHDEVMAGHNLGMQCYHQGRAEVYAEILKDLGVSVSVGHTATVIDFAKEA